MPKFHVWFYSAAAKLALPALYTSRQIRPSIRPSVCPSHVRIVSKRGNTERCGFHNRVAKI